MTFYRTGNASYDRQFRGLNQTTTGTQPDAGKSKGGILDDILDNASDIINAGGNVVCRWKGTCPDTVIVQQQAEEKESGDTIMKFISYGLIAIVVAVILWFIWKMVSPKK